MKFLISITILCICFIVGTSALADKDFAVEIVDDTIEVSVGFDGSSIEIFGDRQNPETDVVIIVEGPRKDITIWKKQRVMGAWINRYYVIFKNMPIYYNYASTMSYEENKKLEIGHEALFDSLEIKKSKNVNEEEFRQALLKQKYKQGVYFDKPVKIDFVSDHLFRVSFDMPPSSQTGDYKIRSLLIKEGVVMNEKTDVLKVRQVGLNAALVSMARYRSITYAVTVILLALFCGWCASIIKIRP